MIKYLFFTSCRKRATIYWNIEFKVLLNMICWVYSLHNLKHMYIQFRYNENKKNSLNQYQIHYNPTFNSKELPKDLIKEINKESSGLNDCIINPSLILLLSKDEFKNYYLL